MRRLLLAALLLVALPLAAAEQPAMNAHKRDSIHTLLELTGVVKLTDQMIDQMLDSFGKSFPSVPADGWTKLRAKMKADDLIEKMLPLYDKYYTQEDLDAMIAFYRTPVGQKVVRTLPDISREGFIIGQEWGKEKGEQVVKELRAEGLLKE